MLSQKKLISLSEAEPYVVAEALRLTLSSILERMRDQVEIEEVQFLIENLWSYTSDEVFGMSKDEIRANRKSGIAYGMYGRVFQCYPLKNNFSYLAAGVLDLLAYLRYMICNPEANTIYGILDGQPWEALLPDPQRIAWYDDVLWDHFTKIHFHLIHTTAKSDYERFVNS